MERPNYYDRFGLYMQDQNRDRILNETPLYPPGYYWYMAKELAKMVWKAVVYILAGIGAINLARLLGYG